MSSLSGLAAPVLGRSCGQAA